ncbi:MAG: hypothetical protein WCX61_05360 [Candidatus Peribacteraceae bacterium]
MKFNTTETVRAGQNVGNYEVKKDFEITFESTVDGVVAKALGCTANRSDQRTARMQLFQILASDLDIIAIKSREELLLLNTEGLVILEEHFGALSGTLKPETA